MSPALGKLLAIAASAVVAFAVVAGALSVADPFTQRRIRFDERRLSDLAGLSDTVGCYWRDQRQLPADSSQFAAWSDSPSSRAMGSVVSRCRWRDAVDPATHSPYLYQRLSDSQFELCAIFSEGAPDGPRRMATIAGRETNHWKHPAGAHCFRFEVRPPVEPGSDPVIVHLPEG